MRARISVLFFCLLFLLSGCTQRKQVEEGAINIYYMNANETALEEYVYFPITGTLYDVSKEILDQMKVTPEDVDLMSPLKHTSIRAISFSGENINVDFAESYLEMDLVQEKLTREAVVFTMCQVTGITSVSFTVEGEQLLNETGRPFGMMTPEKLRLNLR